MKTITDKNIHFIIVGIYTIISGIYAANLPYHKIWIFFSTCLAVFFFTYELMYLYWRSKKFKIKKGFWITFNIIAPIIIALSIYYISGHLVSTVNDVLIIKGSEFTDKTQHIVDSLGAINRVLSDEDLLIQACSDPALIWKDIPFVENVSIILLHLCSIIIAIFLANIASKSSFYLKEEIKDNNPPTFTQ